MSVLEPSAQAARVFPAFDFPLTLPVALIAIDMQPCGVTPGAGLTRAIEEANPGYTRYLVERIETTVVPAIARLQAACRAHDQPVVFTLFGSEAGDGSDVPTSTIRYRDEQRRARTGVSVILPRTDRATDVIPELAVGPNDTVMTKTTMDSFASTSLAETLRGRGVESVIVTGVLTDACVESTARNAAELGFRVFVAEDACAAWEPAFHAQSLANVARYFGRVASSEEIAGWLEEAAAAG